MKPQKIDDNPTATALLNAIVIGRALVARPMTAETTRRQPPLGGGGPSTAPWRPAPRAEGGDWRPKGRPTGPNGAPPPEQATTSAAPGPRRHNNSRDNPTATAHHTEAHTPPSGPAPWGQRGGGGRGGRGQGPQPHIDTKLRQRQPDGNRPLRRLWPPTKAGRRGPTTKIATLHNSK